METKINPTGVQHIHSCWSAQLVFYMYLVFGFSCITDVWFPAKHLNHLPFILIFINCVRLIIGVEPSSCPFNRVVQTLEPVSATGLSLTPFNVHLIS